jgi:hypothetical protein
LLTLRIHDPFTHDSGTYSCEIITPFGNCSTECQLVIEEMENSLRNLIPKIKLSPVESVIQEGDSAMFYSQAENSNSVNVTWFLAGQQISSIDNKIKVNYL